MNEPRWVHLLATVALPGDRTVPMVLGGGGGGAAAEVMAGKGVGWRRYRELVKKHFNSRPVPPLFL